MDRTGLGGLNGGCVSGPRETRSKSVLRSGQELLALLKDTRLAAQMRAIRVVQRYVSLKRSVWTIIRRMIVTLQTERLRTVEQIRGFLDGNGEVDLTPLDRDEAYGFVRRTLVRLDYDALGRAGKGTVREFLGKATGLSRAQVTRLIGQYRATGRVEDRRAANSGRSFERVYTSADIRLLADADEIGGQLCGPAACEVLRRQYEVFGDARFERLSQLSVSHLYNLRRSTTYRARRTTVDHTRPTAVRIGERRRPAPAGKPGYVRVDTVHQGDRNGVKGVYDINLIDEVAQFEHVGAVAGTSI